MTWVTMVGVDSGQRRAMKWVMMWAMMWAMGTMVATMLATMPAKGMAGMPTGRRGGGLLADDAAAAVVAAMAMVAAAYCRGCLLFIVKLFLCGIFMMCEEN
jgi:hypothetical protein